MRSFRSERLPPFGDLRRSFLASANNVELNQPGIAPTCSENVPESSRYCSLQQIGMISENANATLDINGEFYATISSGSRRIHEPSTRTAFVATRTRLAVSTHDKIAFSSAFSEKHLGWGEVNAHV